MIKNNKMKIIVSSLVTLLPMIVGLALWDKLPERLGTSFNWNGDTTGYSSKIFAVAGIPAFLFLINMVCLAVTSADPKRINISSKMFWLILCIAPACSLLCGVSIYSNALGYEFSIESIMPVFVGIMFIALGFFLPKCKQNYTIGIKLPWTLHDEENWNKTHKLAGRLWVVGGIIMCVAGFLKYESAFMIIIIGLVAIPSV